MTSNRDFLYRVFLDTSGANDTLDSFTRRMALPGTVAEASARRGLAQFNNQFRQMFLNEPKLQAKFRVPVTTGRGANAQTSLQNVDFNSLTRKQIGGLSTGQQQRYDFLKYVQDFNRIVRSGNLSQNAIQGLNTRLATLAPPTQAARSVIGQLSQSLQGFQAQAVKANVETRGLHHELQSGIAMRSPKVVQALKEVQSAAQGLMLGMSLAQGNIMGAAFSMIFLGWTHIRTTLLVAAFTGIVLGAVAALSALHRMMTTIISVTSAAGAQMEAFGQRVTSWSRSATEGRRLVTLAQDISVAFGIAQDDADKAVATLMRVHSATSGVMQAIIDAAAATGQSVDQVSQDFANTLLVTADQRKQAIEQFARTYDIQVRQYGSSLQLLTALENRYAGSAAQAADTHIGAVARLNAMWGVFARTVGEVVNGFLRPFLSVGMAFATGLLKGFTAARDAALATGDLQKNAADFTATVMRLVPYALALGVVLGQVLFSALRNLASVTKVALDTFSRLASATKPLRDQFGTTVTQIKKFIDTLIEFAQWLWPKIEPVAGPLLHFLDDLLSGAFVNLLKRIGDTMKVIGDFLTLLMHPSWANAGALGQALQDLMGDLLGVDTSISTTSSNIDGFGLVMGLLSDPIGTLAGLFLDNLIPAIGFVADKLFHAGDAVGWLRDRLEDLGNWISQHNPLQFFADKVESLISALQQVVTLSGQAFGSNGGFSGGGSGPPPDVPTLGGGGGGSWGGQALGGIIPGVRGQAVPIIAHAGEWYGGAPSVMGTPGHAGNGGGAPLQIVVQVSDSVVTNELAMNDFASKIGDRIMRNMTGSRRMTLHRVQGL